MSCRWLKHYIVLYDQEIANCNARIQSTINTINVDCNMLRS